MKGLPSIHVSNLKESNKYSVIVSFPYSLAEDSGLKSSLNQIILKKAKKMTNNGPLEIANAAAP